MDICATITKRRKLTSTPTLPTHHRTHTYATLERPNLHFDAQGVPTHLGLAADLISGDGGCPTAKEPCVNCKYVDHAGTTLIALGV